MLIICGRNFFINWTAGSNRFFHVVQGPALPPLQILNHRAVTLVKRGRPQKKVYRWDKEQGKEARQKKLFRLSFNTSDINHVVFSELHNAIVINLMFIYLSKSLQRFKWVFLIKITHYRKMTKGYFIKR